MGCVADSLTPQFLRVFLTSYKISVWQIEISIDIKGDGEGIVSLDEVDDAQIDVAVEESSEATGSKSTRFGAAPNSLRRGSLEKRQSKAAPRKTILKSFSSAA